MNAHAAPNKEQETERVISTQEFDGFLDQIMFNLYDAIKPKKDQPAPQFISPTITMYRRLDYGEPFDVKAAGVPEVGIDQQHQAFMEMGVSAAQIPDGRIPAAAFVVTMGYKTNPQLGTELDQKQIEQSQQEVVIIAGATIDGRLNQAIYDVKRNKDKQITKVDLQIYVPARRSVTEKSTLENGLLASFYQGFTTEYQRLSQQKAKDEGGERHGGFIIPE